MQPDDIQRVLTDPVSRELLASTIPARLAYNGTDGKPRVVPVGFDWNGTEFVIGSPDNAAKVPALRQSPDVALTIDTETMPPRILLVRGTARVEIVEGVAQEFLDGARRRIAADEWDAFVANTRALYRRMAVIRITPTWAKVIDFERTLPQAIEELAGNQQG